MILAIETTGDSCDIALLDNDRILVDLRSAIPRSHDRLLATLVSQAFDVAECKPEHVSAVALSVGPGSFTGIRIGLSFGIGFAMARTIPVVPVSALDAIAWHGRGVAEIGNRHRILSLIADRRGAVYAALYQVDPVFQRLTAPYNIPIEELEPLLDENILAAGPGAALFDPLVCPCVHDDVLDITAAAIGRYGAELYRKGLAVPFDQVTPLYIAKATPHSK